MRKTPRQDRDRHSGDESTETAVGPIREVLAAEQAAAEALRRCHEEARLILEAARARARAIETTADARIHRVHQIRERAVTAWRERAAVQCQVLYDRAADPDREAALVAAAVEAVVEGLFAEADEVGEVC